MKIIRMQNFCKVINVLKFKVRCFCGKSVTNLKLIKKLICQQNEGKITVSFTLKSAVR